MKELGGKFSQNDLYTKLVMVFKSILSFWWLILIVAILGGTVGKFYADRTYSPTYTSTTTFLINTRIKTVEEQQIHYYASSDYAIATYIHNTYDYVIKSDDLLQTVINDIGVRISPASIKGGIRTERLDQTNILKMTVTTASPQLAYEVSKGIIKYLPDAASKITETGSMDVLEYPKKATTPNSYRNGRLYIMYGFLIGALLVMGIVFLLNFFNNKIKTASDIHHYTNLNILGQVPHIIKTKKLAGMPLLVCNKKMGFSFIELFKSIRTKIENSSIRNNHKVILVTSALEHEGKTTTSCNIAISLAENGHSVLLVDCDLKKPAVYKTLNISTSDGKEVVDVIKNKTTLDGAVSKFGETSLDLLLCSKSYNNSSELISSPKMKEIIEYAREKYDYIILDTPPLKVVTDALIAATLADASIIVIRQETAKFEDIQNIVEEISSYPAAPIGCIFNDVKDVSLFPGSGYKYNKKYGKYYYGGRYYYGKNSKYDSPGR